MDEEVDEVVGPKGRHDPERTAVRHGHEAGEVTLGGRRVQVERPRVRSADGQAELPLQTYAHFADRDPLTKVVLERMLAGVSTRRYRRIQEPVGATVEQTARSTSKSAVSRAFVERTRTVLVQLMGRRLDDVRLAVMMLDGIELKGRTNIVALGITTEGVKIPLGRFLTRGLGTKIASASFDGSGNETSHVRGAAQRAYACVTAKMGKNGAKSPATSSSPPGQQGGNGLDRYDRPRRPHRLAA
jgi:transposase-like protein